MGKKKKESAKPWNTGIYGDHEIRLTEDITERARVLVVNILVAEAARQGRWLAQDRFERWSAGLPLAVTNDVVCLAEGHLLWLAAQVHEGRIGLGLRNPVREDDADERRMYEE